MIRMAILTLKNAGHRNFSKSIMHHKMTVGQISDKFHVSHRTLERRFKKATRAMVVEFIQRVRIEATKKLLSGEETYSRSDARSWVRRYKNIPRCL
jgi:AraC-like DNA-binding protein